MIEIEVKKIKQRHAKERKLIRSEILYCIKKKWK